MVKGKVKWFDVKRGFGFVMNEQEEEVFVHFSNVEKEGFKCLREGQTVLYEEFDAGKGLQGKNVQITETQAAPDTKQESTARPKH